MKSDKMVKIDGQHVPVSKVSHWKWDDSLDAPYTNSLNLFRWQAVNSVLEAWKFLDASVFNTILSKDYEYGSYWVNEPMYGKDAYCDYITGKFETIRKTGSKPNVSIVSIIEALYLQTYAFAIHMKQNKIETLLTFTFSEDKITKMYMTDPDIFTFKDYIFYNYEIGILDENGEPRMFQHMASPNSYGKTMTNDELQAFAVDIVADFLKKIGEKIVAITHFSDRDSPNIVFIQGMRQIHCMVDSYLPPAMEGRKTIDNSRLFVERAYAQNAVPVILPVGLFCMDTGGEVPCCGSTFAVKMLPGLTT